MKISIAAAWAAIAVLALCFGCVDQEDDEASRVKASPNLPVEAGVYQLFVDLDRATLDISEPVPPLQITTLDGHTLEVKNGPAGCAWDPVTYVAACEIIFRNLDSDECMRNVRTRFNGSTNPSAIMDQADYIWTEPGVSYNLAPNTAQPINESGYCITEDFPSSSGSDEGCANTRQESIPPGGVASQNFLFTNVPEGHYTVYLQVFADYQPCPAPAGMALIPAGCFDMGDVLEEGQADELPAHEVCLQSFLLDEHETTNAEYSACVAAGGCSAPVYAGSYSRPSYYGNPAYDDFPVIYVNWNQAAAYCAWAGKRLPTEAEWEYAARGGLAGKRYSWGDGVEGTDANYWGSGDPWDNDTSEVGFYLPNGYGLFDMAGNVWEWAHDLYAPDYYGSSPVDDPEGPVAGLNRVLRGGSFGGDIFNLRVAERYNLSPDSRGSLVGFRCAGN